MPLAALPPSVLAALGLAACGNGAPGSVQADPRDAARAVTPTGETGATSGGTGATVTGETGETGETGGTAGTAFDTGTATPCLSPPPDTSDTGKLTACLCACDGVGGEALVLVPVIAALTARARRRREVLDGWPADALPADVVARLRARLTD